MMAELLALAHRLWQVDDPSLGLFAEIFGVAFEPIEERGSYPRYRAAHRLGTVTASFYKNGCFVGIQVNFPAGMGGASEFRERGVLVFHHAQSTRSTVFHRQKERFEMAWTSKPSGALDGVSFSWSYLPKQIYLHHFDDPHVHLVYGVTSNLVRQVPASSEHPITLGAFVMEFKRNIGVFASPAGPVFFHETDRYEGPFGSVSVTVENGKYRLAQDARKVEIPYTPRSGVRVSGERADSDLVAVMVRGARDRTWWDAYTRPWVF